LIPWLSLLGITNVFAFVLAVIGSFFEPNKTLFFAFGVGKMMIKHLKSFS
jgi:hypothetical protein